MRILITGGAGFIGSHVAECLLERGHEVLVLDNYTTGRRDTLAAPRAKLTVVEGDIGEATAVKKAFAQSAPEVVVHCAASYKDPDDWGEDVRTNVVGTINVVQAAREGCVRRLVYLQTALCYGRSPREQPVTLVSPLHPESSYAISKTTGEQYIALSGLDFVSLRLANIYGPRNLSGPIPTFFSRLVEGRPCFVVNTRRDFVFVQDLVGVVAEVVAGKGTGGYYHVSTGADYSIREVYDAVAGALGMRVDAEERERGADDAPTILLDPSRVQAEFGWKATTPLAEGIALAVAWYRAHVVGQTYTHLRIGAR